MTFTEKAGGAAALLARLAGRTLNPKAFSMFCYLGEREMLLRHHIFVFGQDINVTPHGPAVAGIEEIFRTQTQDAFDENALSEAEAEIFEAVYRRYFAAENVCRYPEIPSDRQGAIPFEEWLSLLAAEYAELGNPKIVEAVKNQWKTEKAIDAAFQNCRSKPE